MLVAPGGLDKQLTWLAVAVLRNAANWGFSPDACFEGVKPSRAIN
jgi:hypothetical protein